LYFKQQAAISAGQLLPNQEQVQQLFDRAEELLPMMDLGSLTGVLRAAGFLQPDLSAGCWATAVNQQLLELLQPQLQYLQERQEQQQGSRVQQQQQREQGDQWLGTQRQQQQQKAQQQQAYSQELGSGQISPLFKPQDLCSLMWSLVQLRGQLPAHQPLREALVVLSTHALTSGGCRMQEFQVMLWALPRLGCSQELLGRAWAPALLAALRGKLHRCAGEELAGVLPQLAFLGLGARVTPEWLEQVTLVTELKSASMSLEQNGKVGRALVRLHAQWEQQLWRDQQEDQLLSGEGGLQLVQQQEQQSLEELREQAQQWEIRWWTVRNRRRHQTGPGTNEMARGSMASLLSVLET
jgi:hypothetical protein